jgi:hypothetical protein
MIEILSGFLQNSQKFNEKYMSKRSDRFHQILYSKPNHPVLLVAVQGGAKIFYKNGKMNPSADLQKII